VFHHSLLGEFDCAKLLTHTLGEEEAADFLLTAISEPIVQQVSLDDMDANSKPSVLVPVKNSPPHVKRKPRRAKEQNNGD
jgi:hypothetical protein